MSIPLKLNNLGLNKEQNIGCYEIIAESISSEGKEYLQLCHDESELVFEDVVNLINSTMVYTGAYGQFSDKLLKIYNSDVAVNTIDVPIFNNAVNLHTIDASIIRLSMYKKYENVFYPTTGTQSNLLTLDAIIPPENCSALFFGLSNLKHIRCENPIRATYLNSTFYNCSNLTTTPEIVADADACFYSENTFYGCSNLESINFCDTISFERLDLSPCIKLSASALYSIAEHLTSLYLWYGEAGAPTSYITLSNLYHRDVEYSAAISLMKSKYINVQWV